MAFWKLGSDQPPVQPRPPAIIYEFPSGKRIDAGSVGEMDMAKHSELSGLSGVGAIWQEPEDKKKPKGVECVITIGHDHPECGKYHGKTSAHQPLYPPLRWLIDECGDPLAGFLLNLLQEMVEAKGGGEKLREWLTKGVDVKMELKVIGKAKVGEAAGIDIGEE